MYVYGIWSNILPPPKKTNVGKYTHTLSIWIYLTDCSCNLWHFGSFHGAVHIFSLNRANVNNEQKLEKKTNLDCTVLTYHSLTMPCDVLFDFLWSEQNKDAQRENLRKPVHIEKVVVWNPVNCVQCLEHTFLKRTKIIKHHYISRVSSRNVLKQNLLYIYIICDSPDIESYRCTIYIYI